MPYVFEEKDFRLAVRALIKRKLYEEHVVSFADSALLPTDAVTEPTEKEGQPSKETKNTSTQSATNSGRDINAERRLRVKAQEAALDFEQTIVEVLNLPSINTLDDSLQESYATIMDEMSAKVQAAVQDAIGSLKAFPRDEE